MHFKLTPYTFHDLQQLTTPTSVILIIGTFVQCGSDRLVKDVFESILSQRRALDVRFGAQLLGHVTSVVDLQYLTHLGQHAFVVPQISLGADQQEGCIWNMVLDLGDPFRLYILVRRPRDDRVTHQEHIGLGVRQWAQSVVVLLTGGIP